MERIRDSLLPFSSIKDRVELPVAVLNFARLDGEDEAAAERRFAQVAECYGFQSLRLAMLDEALAQRN
jgi:hypothetical protein